MNNIIDRSINHGHRAYRCINCVLVFALFTIILLLAYRYPAFTTTTGPHKIQTDERILRSIWYDHSIVRIYNTKVLKKKRLCLQIVLGQTWFELYCTSIFFFCTHSTWTRSRRASPPWSALPMDAIWYHCIVYSCRRNTTTIVNVAFWVLFQFMCDRNNFVVWFLRTYRAQK